MPQCPCRAAPATAFVRRATAGQCEPVPWDRTKPWTAPARSVDLYRSAGRWKFGLANEAGIVDGEVRGVTADDPPQVASAALLLMLAESTGVVYAAQWTEHAEGAWHAELVAPH